jgi:hypothetical protein
MGLDVYAYEIITVLPAHDRNDECYEDESHVATRSDFEHSWGSIPHDGKEGACVEVSGKEMHFRAGSYSGYGEWRDGLSQAAMGVSASTVWGDREGHAGEPFYELIDFSDCDGVFGPEVCAKLAKDFQEHRHDVRPSLEEQWMVPLYDKWQEAFSLAAGRGMVKFS